MTRGSPLSHAEVVEVLGGTEWDRATLFRNLSDLAESGILRHADLGDHLWRYELRQGPEDEGHPHFTCQGCGAVQCLRGLRVEISDAERLPGAVLRGCYEMQLRGLCDPCTAAARGGQGDERSRVGQSQ